VAPTPDQESEQSIEKPDFSVHVTRPNAPKDKKSVPFTYDDTGTLDTANGIDHVKGNVVFEFPNGTLKADAVDYDENTGIATATGHVYYRDYDHDEVMYADSAVYNSDADSGEYRHVKGYMKAKIVARPGLLVSKDPFYFEADWVEKTPEKYILHVAFITDCEMPDPWWTVHSDLIDYYPHDHAIAHNAVYRFRNVPGVFFPDLPQDAENGTAPERLSDAQHRPQFDPRLPVRPGLVPDDRPLHGCDVCGAGFHVARLRAPCRFSRQAHAEIRFQSDLLRRAGSGNYPERSSPEGSRLQHDRHRQD
jgi:hypothetical protein